MSDAVGNELRSRVVGYKLETEDFSESSPNLPQRLAIFGEANTANQADLDLTPKQITSAQQAGELYGFGSAIYLIMRILRPIFGGGIGGIPTVVYPQAAAIGATSKKISITPSGVATGNGTHTLIIAGRGVLDASSYDITINTDDTTDDITAKIEDVVNNVLGTPMICTSTDYEAVFESKWKGLTADELNISVEDNGNDLGITYTIDNDVQSGSGTPSIATSLGMIGNIWETAIVNSYGLVPSIMAALEAVNGVPDPTIPTGRFAAIVGKPFVAISGSVADDPSSITDARKTQVTIAVAPAPNSAGLSLEAAANMALLYCRKAQDTPELDVAGSSYPDMPTPTDIGSMSDYLNRDAFMKKGCSTVSLVNERYVVQDFVTTYHPVGETVPQFQYVRTLYSIDMNIKYTVQIKEQIYVVDHVIANDDDILSVEKFVKPKQWKGVLSKTAEELENRGLIVDSAFMQANTTVGISTTNPYRFNTTFKYKRSGVALISSITAVAGFNYGTLK